MLLTTILGIALGLTVLVGSIRVLIAYRRISALQSNFDALSARVAELLAPEEFDPNHPTSTIKTGDASAPSNPTPAPTPTEAESALQEPSLQDFGPIGQVSPASADPFDASSVNSEQATRWLNLATQHLRENWMAWLGGTCLGLAGIFMVVYTIEQGLLDPASRIVLSALGGLALWTAAELLRRRLLEPVSVFAAMAAGGSITLFATTLAAVHLYEFIGLGSAFGLLSVIALITMVLAVVQGPLLAALGIIGAYAVPIFVSTNSGNIEAALGYSVIVTASALCLLNFVKRSWLWWGPVIGASAWWFISLGADSTVVVRGWYLLAIGYLFVAIPNFDFLLRRTTFVAAPTDSLTSYLKSAFKPANSGGNSVNLLIAFLLLGAMAATSIFFEAQYELLELRWMPLLALILFAARRHEALVLAAWLTTLTTLTAWLCMHLEFIGNRVQFVSLQETFEIPMYRYFTLSAVLVALGSLWNYGAGRSRHAWSALATLTPVLTLLTAYLVTEPQPNMWALLLSIIGFIYIAVACVLINSPQRAHWVIWLFFAGHLAVASAIAIRFAPQTLTFALAAQLLSLTWIMRRFELDVSWLIKALATLLILRLTVNPWLIGYSTEEHWTLWAYGGSTLCCIGAWQLLRLKQSFAIDTKNIAAWLEGAALHLAALTLWVELRYYLYDGDIFQSEFTALEAGLNVVLFGCISIAYAWRSRSSENIAFLYRWFAGAALILASLNYLMILGATLLDLDWISEQVSATPIANIGLLFYGLPVLLYLGLSRFGLHAARTFARRMAGFATFVFINLQIRHWWNGSYDVYAEVTNPELLTYSAVWLIIAVVILINGLRSTAKDWYPTGMALLAIVIAKIFVIDMADLTGLLRVASFLGLGLALLVLSYLHQRFVQGTATTETS
jgi:uncharacterized membrane protein